MVLRSHRERYEPDARDQQSPAPSDKTTDMTETGDTSTRAAAPSLGTPGPATQPLSDFGAGGSTQGRTAVPSAPRTVRATRELAVIRSTPSGPMRQAYPLTQPVARIGSDPTNDIVIDAADVPPFYAEIRSDGTKQPVLSLRSTTPPLYAYGTPVEQYTLAGGDTLHIGDAAQAPITLLYEDASPAHTAQRETDEPDEHRIPLEGRQTVTLGRAPDNDVVLDHPTLSGHHARISQVRPGEVSIADLGSSNGTFVNGMRVRKARLLPGAELRVGPYRFVFTGDELLQYDDTRSVRIDAGNLTDTVSVGVLGRKSKTILDDVSLSILPGSFVAVVGSSGAGKSTLLNALSGQRPADHGVVLYNGQNFYDHMEQFATAIGFVPQDDIIHKRLTVERALFYAARLRLPRDFTRKRIKERIEQVLEDTELVGQRKQLVAALSGGQRKRVSIGVELLAQPAVFFLDEPTSGLDPGLDRKLMELLRRLAERGHTIVLSTHTTSDIDLCDFICFMAPGGRLIYYGPPATLREHFQKDDYADIYNEVSDDPAHWQAVFEQSPEYLTYVASPHLQAQSQSLGSLAGDTPRQAQAAHRGQFRQFLILTQRYLELLSRDRVNLLVLLAQAPIIAAFIVLLANAHVFRNVSQVQDLLHPQDFDAQRTLFIMVATAIWFGIINSAREIVKEAPIYQRERSLNLGIVPYVLSKVVVLGALCAVQSFILLIVVGWKTGYPVQGVFFPTLGGNALFGSKGGMLEMLFTLFLVAMVGLALGLLVSALAPNTDRAMSIVPILLIPQIIFADVIFTLTGAGAYISYVIPARWGMQALGSVVQLSNRFTMHGSDPFYSSDSLHLIGFWAALFILGTAFFLLTLVFQRRKDVRP